MKKENEEMNEEQNIEELQLLIDKLQRENKKISSENVELNFRLTGLEKELKDKIIQSDTLYKQYSEAQEQIGNLEQNLTTLQEEYFKEINDLKLNKNEVDNIKSKFKKYDIVCYLNKYQRMNFQIMSISGSNKDGFLYRIMSLNGEIIEPFIPEKELSYL